ncbi:MAG: C1 family peptidase [Bacteroidota bacterium]|jgi:bleomycin hydrolase
MKKILLLGLFLVPCISLFAQQTKDKANFIDAENKFYKEIQKSIDLFRVGQPESNKKTLKLDFSNRDYPRSISDFKTVWAGSPVSQGATNTCWSFSTTSFYESEVKRISGIDIRLSEQYTVYFETIHKAREFVRTRGASLFDEGSETNAVARMMKLYGMVPYDSYTGLKPGQMFLDHTSMFKEMKQYLEHVKNASAWDEQAVESTIKSMLNHYMGPVPTIVEFKGKKYTPKQYMTEVLRLNSDDYVDFMSLMEKPYWKKVEYDVPDNWWNSDVYHNVPLDVFMKVIDESVRKGYSLAIGGDVSETGIMGSVGVAVVPSYDIPSEFIDESARQMRFSNGSTTDDHAVHLVGWADRKDGIWYLIKDSGSGAHNNPGAKGYYFFHSDYVKLKMMSFTIHKDAVKDVLSKF